MITEYILQTLFNIVIFLIDFIAIDSINQFFVDNSSYVSTLLSPISFFSSVLPIGHILTCIGILLIYHNAAFFWSIITWVLRKLPFIN
jgi:hypothetical protein